ncbi:hypothetical protein TorRG33x02_134430 [Trema orientale]|uniref:Uncharacterized protein n=1 Tax=Trema orientale TaxID=63057 RepID=A0A2P5EZ43_TREOI|nr:hypothetical protein TorRG33x02_134430 [Trema orientale]
MNKNFDVIMRYYYCTMVFYHRDSVYQHCSLLLPQQNHVFATKVDVSYPFQTGSSFNLYPLQLFRSVKSRRKAKTPPFGSSQDYRGSVNIHFVILDGDGYMLNGHVAKYKSKIRYFPT